LLHQKGNLQHAEGLGYHFSSPLYRRAPSWSMGSNICVINNILVSVFDDVINPKTFNIIKIQKHLKTQKDSDFLTNVSPLRTLRKSEVRITSEI
jgi:hypothetical protein